MQKKASVVLHHFSQGTEKTVTGQHIGLEIETDFVDESTNRPISIGVSRAILDAAPKHDVKFRVLPELGRQKIELAIDPHTQIDYLLDDTRRALNWLYATAKLYGARPVFGRNFNINEKLLMITEPRDQLWADLDGREALEELCRCSSVQFTIDVNPQDAIPIINSLWASKLHELDYVSNNARWQHYITTSKFNYRGDRYGGPNHFDDLADYSKKLSRQYVVMHDGKPSKLDPDTTPNLDIELYLRSVWWHYRLRRYGQTLTVEIRPFTRRDDWCLEFYWNSIAPIFGLDTINKQAVYESYPLVAALATR